jgi:hypothetical protein
MEFNMDFIAVLADVGFPIAAAIASGYFVFLTLRFILNSVVESIKDMIEIIDKLNNRVQVMNNDIIKIDLIVSSALDLEPDTTRVSRIENRMKERRD